MHHDYLSSRLFRREKKSCCGRLFKEFLRHGEKYQRKITHDSIDSDLKNFMQADAMHRYLNARATPASRAFREPPRTEKVRVILFSFLLVSPNTFGVFNACRYLRVIVFDTIISLYATSLNFTCLKGIYVPSIGRVQIHWEGIGSVLRRWVGLMCVYETFILFFSFETRYLFSQLSPTSTLASHRRGHPLVASSGSLPLVQ